MRLLLDECVPQKLRLLFVAAGHDCETVRQAGWEGVTNGELLAKAEFLFDVLITVDKICVINRTLGIGTYRYWYFAHRQTTSKIWNPSFAVLSSRFDRSSLARCSKSHKPEPVPLPAI